MSTPSRKKCGHLWKRVSSPRRVQNKPKRHRQDQRSSTSQGKDDIDKTTTMGIDTVKKTDDKRLAKLDQWNWCNTPHWERTDGRQPSCNHPSEATSQIASDCKVKNYIQRSTSAHRERRPQASEKRRTLLPSLDISKVSPKLYYESRKRKLKTRLIYGDRCDERLKN